MIISFATLAPSVASIGGTLLPAGPTGEQGPPGDPGTPGTPGAPGAPGVSIGMGGQAQINFGAFPGAADASITVTDTQVLTTSAVSACILAQATGDHSADEHFVEELDILVGNIVASTGFTIYARCRNGRAYGAFNLSWLRR